jgi:hypothetical protein
MNGTSVSGASMFHMHLARASGARKVTFRKAMKRPMQPGSSLVRLRRTFAIPHLVVLFGVALLIGLGGCSLPAGSAGSALAPSPPSSIRPRPSPPQQRQLSVLAALPLLQKSIQAGSAVQTVHVTIASHGTVQTSGAAQPLGVQSGTYQLSASLDSAVKSAEGSGHETFTFTPASGKAQTIVSATEIVTGHTLSVQGGNSQTWQTFDLDPFASQVAMDTAGFPGGQALLSLFSRHVTITDEGVTPLDHARLHHFVITFDAQSASALAAALGPSLAGQITGGLRLLAPLSVDLFLNEETALPARIEVSGKGQVNLDTVRAATENMTREGRASQAQLVTVTFSFTMTFSNYNQPVAIEAPLGSPTN